jgi:hypothetical protein
MDTQRKLALQWQTATIWGYGRGKSGEPSAGQRCGGARTLGASNWNLEQLQRADMVDDECARVGSSVVVRGERRGGCCSPASFGVCLVGLWHTTARAGSLR